jgi:hypothetical protein
MSRFISSIVADFAIVFALCSFIPSVSAQQVKPGWSVAEIRAADLARGRMGWSEAEVETLLHLNLARMYPKKYWELELSVWQMPKTYSRGDDADEMQSLKRLLTTLEPMQPVRPHDGLKAEAACLAQEQSRSGRTGHNRSAACPTTNGWWAENCSYGMESGRDVIAQFLIDNDVPSLGHRMNCLNPIYTIVGISQASHAKFHFVTVMDLLKK